MASGIIAGELIAKFRSKGFSRETTPGPVFQSEHVRELGSAAVPDTPARGGMAGGWQSPGRHQLIQAEKHQTAPCGGAQDCNRDDQTFVRY
jgi:hypothetical protein